jgi:predicted transcriptional regulator
VIGLWDPCKGAFDGPALRRAIVSRGWTPHEFARATRLNVGSIYNAMRGKRVRDATVIRVFEVLEKRDPMRVAHP